MDDRHNPFAFSDTNPGNSEHRQRISRFRSCSTHRCAEFLCIPSYRYHSIILQPHFSHFP
nr:MAG TPA: hypothetical protein [Caudoviricetes sp.]